MRFLVTKLIILSLLAGCGRDTTTAPAPIETSQIARDYQRFKLMTPKPVPVDPQLAGMCRGLSSSDIAQAIKRSGPHAQAWVSIYMSDSAATAFEKSTAYPVGSIVIKEKRIHTTPDSQGVGGMVKRAPGYDPAHGDWEYFYFEDPAKIETGKIASCVQCHTAAAKTDYVFGSWSQHH